MNRRNFLGWLAAAGAVVAVPELLLPKRTFFLPPAGGWRGFVPVNFHYGLEDFERRIMDPAMQRLTMAIDTATRLQLGDIVTFDNVFESPKTIHTPQRKLFVVTSTSRGAW